MIANLEAEQKAKDAARAAEVNKARKMAAALQTQKFTIKKPVGEEDKIFGTVTSAEVVDAIYQQTSQTLDKKIIDVPAINHLGEFEVTIKLHPEVTARATVVVAKE